MSKFLQDAPGVPQPAPAATPKVEADDDVPHAEAANVMASPPPEKKDTPEVTIKKGPELTAQAAAPVAANPVTEAPVVAKKGGSGKCFLISCIVVLVLCVLSVVGLYLLARYGTESFFSASVGPDPNLTRYTSFEDAKRDAEEFRQNNAVAPDDFTGGATFRLSERQALALLIESLNVNDRPELMGMDIEEGQAKIEIALALLLQATNQEQEAWKGLEEAYASIVVKVAPDGKTLEVSNVSLGNSVLDSLLGESVARTLNDGLGSGFNVAVGDDAMQVTAIEFKKDEMVINVAKGLPPTSEPAE